MKYCIIMTFGYATSWILLQHLAKAHHNQILLFLTHTYFWVIRHRFLALSGLRCPMMRHRFSSTFSQVWLYGIIESYIWHILSYASWILEGISCHISYIWVTNPMRFPPMSIIKWAFLLSFSILKSLNAWILESLSQILEHFGVHNYIIFFIFIFSYPNHTSSILMA